MSLVILRPETSGFPTPFVPLPRPYGAYTTSTSRRGRGMYFEGDGGGVAAPVPFEVPPPLRIRLRALKVETMWRGGKGVRHEIHLLKAIFPI
jgi:hypothetical protein